MSLVTALRRGQCCAAVWTIAGGALAFAPSGLDAAAVSGWGLETGAQAATLTEGVPGSFSTTTPSGNACPRALITPMSIASIGDSVVLHGTVTLQNAPGNQQFRFGLYDTNGHATGTLSGGLWTGADNTGWQGYMAEIGGGGGNDTTVGRNSGAWFSGTGAYSLGNGPGGATSPPAATPYDFTLALSRLTATSVSVNWTFVGGSVNRSGSFVDNNAGASVNADGIDAVGFLTNGNTGSAQFSNVDVSVPEPMTMAVLAFAVVPALVRRSRKL